MLNAAGRTHTGRVRPQNEDALLCRPEEGLFAVVDGMGGEKAGEVAAAYAVAEIGKVQNRRRLDGREELRRAFHAARAQILAEAQRNPDCKNMGAVATALRFDDHGRTVVIAHVGDTRAYLVNGGGARQLTADDVAPGVEGRKPAVARDLGRADLPADWVSLSRVAVKKGDLLVICSDGLYEPAGEELAPELGRLWRSGEEADTVAARLVALALARGGPDNISVVVARVGRWRRPSRMPKLPPGAAAALLFVLCTFAVVGGALRAGRAPNQVPTAVKSALTLSSQDRYELAGPTTTVASGKELRLRGTSVAAPAWELEVADGGQVVIDRSVLLLDRELHVSLGAGANLELRDCRIQAAAVRVDAEPGATVAISHCALPETVLWSEGVEPTLDDVRYLAAPRGPEVPPAPGATGAAAPGAGPPGPGAAPTSPPGAAGAPPSPAAPGGPTPAPAAPSPTPAPR